MNTLLKIIREIDGKKVIDLKKVPSNSFNLAFDPSIQINPMGFNTQFMSSNRGTLTFSYISTPELIEYFMYTLNLINYDEEVRPRIFDVEIYVDIDRYDADDIEDALNIRSVHYSPDPDLCCKDCFITKFDTKFYYDFVNDIKRPYLENIEARFHY